MEDLFFGNFNEDFGNENSNALNDEQQKLNENDNEYASNHLGDADEDFDEEDNNRDATFNNGEQTNSLNKRKYDQIASLPNLNENDLQKCDKTQNDENLDENEKKIKRIKIQEDLLTKQKELLKKRKLEQQEEENKKMQVLMANFSEEQLNRYEMFRRAAFPKSNIKKIIQTVCGKTVSASVIIAMSGIAKVFVGEIVELALDTKHKWSDQGPIQPKHLREAFRIFKKGNKLNSPQKYKRPPMLV